ncbi:G-protein coupled receptor 35 [Lepus europaeus]|uniref:G-protein coupled receptor 35 n=1 Tax=Lepus europaeus TaxID=9983 RepID=UPI002B471CD7|nr:G-protein coupled receptor 35 [Lepus europaeus]
MKAPLDAGYRDGPEAAAARQRDRVSPSAAAGYLVGTALLAWPCGTGAYGGSVFPTLPGLRGLQILHVLALPQFQPLVVRAPEALRRGSQAALPQAPPQDSPIRTADQAAWPGDTAAYSPGTMNDTCGSGNLTWPPWLEHTFSAYLTLLLVLGLLLNGLALWVFCRRMRGWTEARVYMTNLAGADLCLLCALPFMLHSLNHTSDTPLCQLSQAVYLLNRYMSIGLVMAIAVDRYVAVRHPLRARGLRSPRQAAAVCGTLWVLVAGSLGLRWLLGVQEGGFCFRSRSGHTLHTSVFSLLGFYPPLAVLAFCSLQVGAALARSPAASSGQGAATRRAARMVWANLAVFVVCFLPLHAVLTAQLAMGLQPCAVQLAFRRALFVTSKLSDANCCLDAICYYYTAREFQEASALGRPHSAKACKSHESLCVTLT